MLNNKNILLGICGSIAAYKSPDIVRRLIENGASVKVILTSGGAEFVTKMSLEAVGAKVVTNHNKASMPHISLAKWADIIIIAPISANKIAEINSGAGNDLLSLVVLSTKAKIFIAPAMNKEMFVNPATQDNLKQLAAKNINVLPSGFGSQACGDIGPGRMLEAEKIVEFLIKSLGTNKLSGKNILITLGATIEQIDPVRYISNFSSGKMGTAIANEAILRGLNTTIVYGHTSVNLPEKSNNIKALSAKEMLVAVEDNIAKIDIFISVAAISDYRAKNITTKKIKKDDNILLLELVKNPDILSTIAGSHNKLFCVGFAAESEDLLTNANKKLQNKKLDLIVANNIKDGFAGDDNKVMIIDKGQNITEINNSKTKIAKSLLDIIEQKF